MADWECQTLPKTRPSIAQISGLFQAAAKKRQGKKKKDTDGNDLITSSRTLGGRTAGKTLMKPPPKLTPLKLKPRRESSRLVTTTPKVSSPRSAGASRRKRQSPKSNYKPKRRHLEDDSSRSHRPAEYKRYDSKPYDSHRSRSRTRQHLYPAQPTRSRSRSRNRRREPRISGHQDTRRRRSAKRRSIPFYSIFHFDNKKWKITFHLSSIFFPQNGTKMEWKRNGKGMEKKHITTLE